MEYVKLTDGVEIKEIIQVKYSHTTDSCYIIFKGQDNNIYQLSISDHYADNHDQLLGLFEDADKDLVIDELTSYVKDDEFYDALQAFTYYGFEKASAYDESNVFKLVGKGNLDRALSGQYHDLSIESVGLLENNQILAINDHDLSINYIPKVEAIDYVEKMAEAEISFKDYYEQSQKFHEAELELEEERAIN